MAKLERFELRLDAATLDRIDTWRSETSDIPTRSEAVRRLVEAGLGHERDDQLFQMMRFNILLAAKTPGMDKHLSGAYVYAWDNGIYPFFHEASHFHEPFESYFKISKEKVKELATYLDNCWNKNKVPTFYELEDHYEVRSGRSGWDRVDLMLISRYMFLQRLFDKAFWSKLLKPSEHPTEASSIARKFSMEDDIYLH